MKVSYVEDLADQTLKYGYVRGQPAMAVPTATPPDLCFGSSQAGSAGCLCHFNSIPTAG